MILWARTVVRRDHVNRARNADQAAKTWERLCYSRVNNKIFWFSNMTDTFVWEIYEVLKGFSWLCFPGADWLVLIGWANQMVEWEERKSRKSSVKTITKKIWYSKGKKIWGRKKGRKRGKGGSCRCQSYQASKKEWCYHFYWTQKEETIEHAPLNMSAMQHVNRNR